MKRVKEEKKLSFDLRAIRTPSHRKFIVRFDTRLAIDLSHWSIMFLVSIYLFGNHKTYGLHIYRGADFFTRNVVDRHQHHRNGHRCVCVEAVERELSEETISCHPFDIILLLTDEKEEKNRKLVVTRNDEHEVNAMIAVRLAWSWHQQRTKRAIISTIMRDCHRHHHHHQRDRAACTQSSSSFRHPRNQAITKP